MTKKKFEHNKKYKMKSFVLSFVLRVANSAAVMLQGSCCVAESIIRLSLCVVLSGGKLKRKMRHGMKLSIY